MEKLYINVHTGSVDTYDGWWYEDESGQEVNAVDRGEVVELQAKTIAAALGRVGGRAKSDAKARAARENGKKGGRPRKSSAQKTFS